MPLAPEDRHFSAFRRTGDPDELARVFDATAPKLLRVGVHLTRDPHAAEDLLQATFLTAIESASDHSEDVPVIGWLLAILANRARHLRRQSGRCPDPSRFAERTAPDPVGGAAERELNAELTTALAELPVKYSQVLELHLVHGLDANEIAQVLRRPGGTVRTQICRGLDQLRRALPTGLAVGGVVTMTTGRGLAMVRERVMQAAAGRCAADVAAVSGLAGLGGLLLMKKTLLGVIAFAVTAATAALLWYPSSAVPAPGGSGATPQAPAVERSALRDEPPAPRPAEEVPVIRTDAVAHAGEAKGTRGDVQLHCVWASDGAPVAEIQVWRYRHDEGSGGPIESATSDAAGMVTFTALPVGSYDFRAGKGEVAVTVLPDRANQGELRIEAVAIVHGRVVDDGDRAIAGAQIDAAVGNLPRTVATSAADGSFDLRLATTGEIWAHKATWQPSVRHPIQGPENEVVLTLSPGGHEVTGVVIDPVGRPVRNALVMLTAAREAGPAARQAPVVTHTDGNGRFVSQEVAVGTHTAYAIAEGFAFAESEVAVVAAAAVPQVTLQLRAGATVHGVARRGERRDQPVVGLAMLIMRDNALPGMFEGVSDHLIRRETTTAGDGSYRFTAVPPGRMWVIAMVGTPKNTNVVLQDGQDLEWNPDLSPPGSRSIRGRLEGPDGTPLANWQLRTMYLNLATRTPETAAAITDGDGGFELRNLRDQPYDVQAYAPGGARDAFAVRQAQRPGEAAFVWRLASLPEDDGVILGSIAGPDGQPFDGASVSARQGGLSRKGTVAAGAFRLEGLPPGTWSLSGYRKDYGSFALGEHTVAARATLDVGPQRLAAAGRLLVRIQPASVAAERLSYRLVQEEGGANTSSRFDRAGAAMRSPALPPGRYRLSVCGEGIAPIERSLLLAPGDDTTVDVSTAVATTVVFEFTPEDLATDQWDDYLELELLDASARALVSRTLAVRGATSQVVRIGLPPGAYTVRGTANMGAWRKGREAFVVPERAVAPITVRVPLVIQKE